MNTFEITIQRKTDEGWPVVVEYSQSGNFLPFREEGLFLLNRQELLKQVSSQGYGTVLGKALFRDEVRDAFVRARTLSEDYLRVLLFIEADDLKALHWERLCGPLDMGWNFLTLDQRLPFSLYLPSLTDRRFPPIGRHDLRSLVLIANPDGLDEWGLAPFDAQKMLDSLKQVLGDMPFDVLSREAGSAGPPTLDEWCTRLTVEQYTLLHIVSHGRYQPEIGETTLYLADAGNQVDAVTGTDILTRLSRIRGARGLPHFVFLAACQSGSVEAEDALGGLAQRFVRELGMPAVVAMTEPVTITTIRELTTHFYRQLRQHGEVDRALTESVAGLTDRHDITIPALYSRLGGRPLFSDTLDRALTNQEIRAGLDRMAKHLDSRAPVLRPLFDEYVKTLQHSLGAELAVLRQEIRQERIETLIKINALCLEVLEITFNALAFGQEPPPYDDRSPFIGLYPFHIDNQEFFFGREPLIAELLEHLRQHHFLAILGPSGSGKSSLVFAGLIPAYLKTKKHAAFASLTPGDDPVVRLESAVGQGGKKPDFLIVDQFEELFTLCPTEEFRRTFLARFLNLPQEMDVVLTMRADFWGYCAPYPELKEKIQTHQELIAPMDAEELRRSMERQAAAVGLRFEANLSQKLLEDVKGEPGAMPLLQHALLELWNRRHGRWLRGEEYQAIGGVQQAIAHTAEDIYTDLTEQEQALMRHIFIRLTRLDEETIQGEERRDTRRRVEEEDLTPTDYDQATTKLLITRLANVRLLVTGRNETSDKEEVEVAHEALIRHWPRLRNWLDEDRTTIRLRDNIALAADDWEAKNRDESFLIHRGSRLEDAQRLLQHRRFPLNQQEEDYIKACGALQNREQAKEEAQRQRELQLERRSRRRLQWLVLVLGTLVSIGAGFLMRQEYLRYITRKSGEPRVIPGSGIAFERYEVTNSRYAACVAVRYCSPPPRQLSTYFDEQTENMPVTGVDVFDAAAFCQWIGRRLPTLKEWKAAVGSDFPWGKDPITPEYAHLDYSDRPEFGLPDYPESPKVVGSRPKGANPTGIEDLIGNVAEWTATSSEQQSGDWDGNPASAPLLLIFAGGDYETTISGIHNAFADLPPARGIYRRGSLGFRCVEDLQQ